MTWKDKDKFCLVPFITLNTRPNGQVKPCSQVMGMVPIKRDRTVDTLMEPGGETLNLTRDTVAEVWNTVFMRDFRMRKIRNEYIPFCETCYQEDRMGLGTSKRKSVIEANYNSETEALVREAAENDGFISSMPIWWELRLSSLCNQACRMCIPQTSSRMRDEFASYVDELPAFFQPQARAAIDAQRRFGNLGDSSFFVDQVIENIADVRFIEIHGGEPTIEPRLWELLTRIVETGHASHIHIHVHTNVASLKPRHIELWREFKSGWFGASIDAFGKENEYIRHGSSWAGVEQNLQLCRGLGSHWQQWVTGSVSTYNALTMDRVLDWFDRYVSEHDLKDLAWRSDPVVNPNHMRIEHIPLELREEAIGRLEPLLDRPMATTHPKAELTRKHIIALMQALRSSEMPPVGSFDDFVTLTRLLDEKRSENVLTIFPHLAPLFT